MRPLLIALALCCIPLLTASAALADTTSQAPNSPPAPQVVQKKSWPATFKRQRPDTSKSAGNRQRWKRTRSDDYDTVTKATEQSPN